MSMYSAVRCHGITHNIAITAAEHRADLVLTKDTPYPTLMGEILVSVEIILEKIERIALYIHIAIHSAVEE